MKKRFLLLFVLLVACIVLCGCETPVSRTEHRRRQSKLITERTTGR